MKHIKIMLLTLCFAAGCAKHESAPIERTNVGNGGNETVTAFLNQSDTILSQIERSYEASEYAELNQISISKLRAILEGNHTPVSLVSADEVGVRNDRLFLDEFVWNARYESGRASSSQVLNELFRLLEVNDRELKVAELVRRLPVTTITQSEGFLGKVQLVGKACDARSLHVELNPGTQSIELSWDFGTRKASDFSLSMLASLGHGAGIHDCTVKIPVKNGWKMGNFVLASRAFAQEEAKVQLKVSLAVKGQRAQVFVNDSEISRNIVESLVASSSEFLPATETKAALIYADNVIELNLSSQALTRGYAMVSPEKLILHPHL